jgi:hypothetical protein
MGVLPRRHSRQAKVLEILRCRTTTEDLATAIYGDSSHYNLYATRSLLYNLRQRGVKISSTGMHQSPDHADHHAYPGSCYIVTGPEEVLSYVRRTAQDRAGEEVAG